MKTETPVSLTAATIPSRYERGTPPSLCWRAIIGGTVAAIGIHILLTALGVGAGLPTFSPITDTNPIGHFSAGAALVWTICALVALWFGGLIAGRFSHSLHSGFVHGTLVWSLTLIITLLLLSMGTGMILGGALKVLGEGLGIGSKAVASGVGDITKEGIKRTGDELASFIDEAAQSVPTNSAPKATTRARREIGLAVTKLFAPGNNTEFQNNRSATLKILTEYTGMSEADATRTIDEWAMSYKNLQSELEKLKAVAEQKAKEAADQAARNLTCAAIWSFFALLIGLLVTAFAGSCGARRAVLYADSQIGPVR